MECDFPLSLAILALENAAPHRARGAGADSQVRPGVSACARCGAAFSLVCQSVALASHHARRLDVHQPWVAKGAKPQKDAGPPAHGLTGGGVAGPTTIFK